VSANSHRSPICSTFMCICLLAFTLGCWTRSPQGQVRLIALFSCSDGKLTSCCGRYVHRSSSSSGVSRNLSERLANGAAAAPAPHLAVQHSTTKFANVHNHSQILSGLRSRRSLCICSIPATFMHASTKGTQRKCSFLPPGAVSWRRRQPYCDVHHDLEHRSEPATLQCELRGGKQNSGLSIFGCDEGTLGSDRTSYSVSSFPGEIDHACWLKGSKSYQTQDCCEVHNGT
jgi:hypothetical protein